MSFLTSLRSTLSPSTTSTTRLLPTMTKSTPTLRSFSSSPASPLARISLVGRLADAPELVATSTGQDVVRYALGTSHGPRDNRQTSWWKVACFLPEGKGREVVVGLGKGSLLYVEGDCSMSKFQGKDGTAQSALSIVQRSFEVLERREGRGEGVGEGEGE